MATVQDRNRTAAPAKYEGFVEQQLGRVRWRIRLLDLTAAGLGLAGLTLLYALVMVGLDRWLELPSLFRQAGLLGFGAIVLGFLAYGLLRPWLWRVNPYYAARQMEQTLPGAKNSVVNWLDLRDQKLPPAIRQAVGLRAARDLAQADLDRAINGRRVGWLGGLTAALLMGAIVALFILRPGPFLSLLNRAFAPFTEGTIATRTRIDLRNPIGGDATVAVNQSIAFTVLIEGRVPEYDQPDAVRLLFRYNANDPSYQERPFRAGDNERNWTLRLPAAEVHNGFYYKVAAGDAMTPEYRVQVRSTPLFTGFEVTYRFRDYLRWSETKTTDPNLKQIRGTEVQLVARTNRNVQEGRLLIKGDVKPLTAMLLPEDPTALQFNLVLDKDAQYTIEYTSLEGEKNADPPVYSIQITHDQTPRVELTLPGGNVKLPANGVLTLEGVAGDDIGLTSLGLHMRLKDGPSLDAKPFRPGKSFQFADGGYPRVLEYKDAVELDKVTQNQTAFPLKPGTILEYWLEATDNCDFPAPNVGRSQVFEVEILAPDADKSKQDAQKDQARQDQKAFEKKQDNDLKKEAEERKNQPKEGDQANEEQKKKLEEQFDKIKKALEDEQKQKDKGDVKPEPPPPEKGEPKDGGNKPENGTKPENGNKPENDNKQDQGDNKPKPNGDPQAGMDKQDKDAGQNSTQGDKKPEGQGSKPKDDQKADGKPQGQPQNEPGSEPSNDKGAGQESMDQAKGGEKPQPKDGGDNGGQKKDDGKPENSQNASNQGENKPDSKGTQTSKGLDKDTEQNMAKASGEPKPGDNGKPGPESTQADSKAPPKAGTDKPTGDDKGQGQPQPGGMGGDDKAVAKGDNPPSQAGDMPPAAGKGEPPPMAKAEPKDAQGGSADGKPAEGSAKNQGSGNLADAKQGQEKATPAEGAGGGTAKGADEDGPPKGVARAIEDNGNPKKKLTPQEFDQLVKDLNGSDPQKREQAARQLGEQSKDGTDPGMSKAAAEALKKAGYQAREPGDGPNGPEKPEKPPMAKPTTADAKGPAEGPVQQEPGTGKGGETDGKVTKAEQKQADRNPANGNEKAEDPKGQPGQGKEPPQVAGNQQDGNQNPGGGHGTDRPGAPRPDDGRPDPADPRHKLWAGDLQLEELKKQLTPDVLKKMGWTQEDLDRFVKNYKNINTQRKPEILSGPQNGGVLSNQGTRPVEPGSPLKSANLENAGPALPPPEIRDPFRAYMDDLSRLKK